jgi:hypothetical protein
MHSYDEAQEALDQLKKADEKYRNDIRFSHLRTLAVSIATKSMRYDDPHKDPIRDRYEAADRAATLMLAMIYDQDAELAALRSQIARYEKLTLDIAVRSPPTMVIPRHSSPG